MISKIFLSILAVFALTGCSGAQTKESLNPDRITLETQVYQIDEKHFHAAFAKVEFEGIKCVIISGPSDSIQCDFPD